MEEIYLNDNRTIKPLKETSMSDTKNKTINRTRPSPSLLPHYTRYTDQSTAKNCSRTKNNTHHPITHDWSTSRRTSSPSSQDTRPHLTSLRSRVNSRCLLSFSLYLIYHSFPRITSHFLKGRGKDES